MESWKCCPLASSVCANHIFLQASALCLQDDSLGWESSISACIQKVYYVFSLYQWFKTCFQMYTLYIFVLLYRCFLIAILTHFYWSVMQLKSARHEEIVQGSGQLPDWGIQSHFRCLRAYFTWPPAVGPWECSVCALCQRISISNSFQCTCFDYWIKLFLS